MPPLASDTRPNPIAGPGDYTTTTTVHSDTYPSISPLSHPPTNKRVLISGASKGIGRATALSFARSGASHIAIGARSPLSSLSAEIQAAAQEARRPPPQVLELCFDVTDEAGVAAARREVETQFGGRLDILVLMAGLFRMGRIVDVSVAEWWRVWEVQVKGAFLMCRAFVPLMLEGGGDRTVVAVSSVGAHCVGGGLSAYQSSKLALLRLMEFLAAEHAEDGGVLAYAVHPGNVAGTEIFGEGAGVPEGLEHVFVDTAALAGDTLAFLTRERREWLGGRYVNVTWDMEEFLALEKEVLGTERFKVRMVL